MDVRDRRAALRLALGRSLVLALTALLAGPASAQEGGSASEPPKVAVPDPAWTAIEREFVVVWQGYRAELQRAQQQKVDPAKRPANPVNEYWDRCKAFADRGELGAIRWCLSYSEGLSLPPAARNQRRQELYRGWIASLPEGPAMKEMIRSLQYEANPNRLGAAATLALLAEVADRVQDKALRGEARISSGLLLLSAGGPENLERAREAIALGIEDDPHGESVATARGRLFQVDRLQIGMPCPDFTAKDVDGVEFKRSDSLGKVVVLDFWGFW